MEGSSAPVPGTWRVSLKPKYSAAYALDFVVRAPEFLPYHMELTVDDYKIVSELLSIEINPKLDPHTFDKPPPGLPSPSRPSGFPQNDER